MIEGNGRHEETRTPDRYRVKKRAPLWSNTTCFKVFSHKPTSQQNAPPDSARRHTLISGATVTSHDDGMRT